MKREAAFVNLRITALPRPRGVKRIARQTAGALCPVRAPSPFRARAYQACPQKGVGASPHARRDHAPRTRITVVASPGDAQHAHDESEKTLALIQNPVCDINNGHGAERVIEFSLYGTAYSIDVCKACGSELDDAMRKFVEAARKADEPRQVIRKVMQLDNRPIIGGPGEWWTGADKAELREQMRIDLKNEPGGLYTKIAKQGKFPSAAAQHWAEMQQKKGGTVTQLHGDTTPLFNDAAAK